MTCIKRYDCDMCGKPMADGIGICFEANNRIVRTPLSEGERHLCNRCIEELRDMLKPQRS
jgi:hypothetical protein